MANVTFTTVKRAMGISKTYIAGAIFLSIIAITLWNGVYNTAASATAGNATGNSTLNSSGNAVTRSSVTAGGLRQLSGVPIISVPLDAIPTLALATPVILLFVYDKNNGVLEYLLSLGMTQRDIYMRYLKAALLLTAIFVAVFTAVNMLYSYEVYGPAVVARLWVMMLLVIPLALAVVSLLVILMMAFSSLQKTRAGSNQPLGLVIGYACTIPAYLPVVLPYDTAVLAEAAIIAIMAVVGFVSLMSAGRLVRREKLLP